ncbi:hypothetical protein PG991_001689 [Apiospora marii]|uniref:Uncharacterized protein n=1 Tax=Apiospora marii TaxID=335849 RepID=A0ABR1SQI6_9PEZI
MPGYLETVARLSIDEDVAEAGKCFAQTKPEGKPHDLGDKPVEAELFARLMDQGTGRDRMRLFFIVSGDEKNPYKHGHGLARCLRTLVETADLPSKFVVDLCRGEDWTVIPTTISSIGARGNATERSLVLQYGFYRWAEKADPSFALQVISSQKTTSFYCLNFPVALTDFMNRQLRANPNLVQKPMFLNILILEFTLRSYQKGIREQRDRLRHIEQGNSKEDVKKQAETLHDLSVQWHCMLKDLEDIKQHIEALLSLQMRLDATSKEKSMSPQAVHEDDEARAATDDLHHLEAVRGFWARWANTYLERTNIRIQLIAVQTQRESMAMFTLALVTVLFLPGTFVASILSTSFFNYDGTDYNVSDNIAPVLVPSLIGATLLVLLSWFAWYQWRLYRLSKGTAGSHALD